MRRLLAVAVLATTLFTAAACGGSDNKTPQGNGSTPTGNAGGADNTKEVCAAAEAAVTAGMTTFLTEMGNGIAAAAAGEEAKLDAAEKAMKSALDEMVSKMRAEGVKANKAELKTAIETTATAFSQVDTTDIDKIDETKLEAAGAELEKLCGK